ncbi:MAG: LamG-like jellyroll fold domain-containing protein [Chloroflexota bacterium]|nr:LamG-like jellyroll fold domain-containing protein [Chloroflexota bacterium]
MIVESSRSKPSRGAELNRTHRLARGLCGCWLFNEGSGTKLMDYTRQGSIGTTYDMNDATNWIAGNSGHGLFFDGVDDYASCGSNGVLDITGPISIVSFCEPHSLSQTHSLVTKGQLFDEFDAITYSVLLDSDGHVIYGIDNLGEVEDFFVTTMTVGQYEWQMIAATFDPDTDVCNIYINTNKETGSITTNTTSKASEDLCIGALVLTGVDYYHWHGNMDSLFIWSRFLSDDEIYSIYSNPYDMFVPARYGLAPIHQAYYFLVDWNNDGDFIDPEEDITTDIIDVTTTIGKDEKLPYEMVKAGAGTCEITVKNTDNKYNPGNTSSPLYGNLVPRRAVKFYADHEGSTYDIFYGYIEDIIPHPKKTEQTARILCVDGMDFLARADSQVALKTNEKAGALLGYLLDSAGWSATKRSLSTGIDDFVLYWAEGKSLTEIRKIEDTDLGFFYIDESGNAVFEDRHYRLVTSRCINSQGTFNETMVDIAYLMRAKSIFNEIVCPVTPRTLNALGQIWEMIDVDGGNSGIEVPFINAGTTATYWADFDNFAKDIVDPMVAYPTSNYNYRGNAADDNSGADRTSDITCTITPFAKSAKIVVENTGSSGLYLTYLDVRGKLYVDGDQVQTKAEDSTSQNDYQKRTASLTGDFMTDLNTGQSRCDYILTLRKDPQPEIEIDTIDSSTALKTQILARKVSDRITIIQSDLGVNDDYYINKIVRTWTRAGNIINCSWTVAATDSEMFWILNTSQLGGGYAYPSRLGY